jgi:sugar phosphate permease
MRESDPADEPVPLQVAPMPSAGLGATVSRIAGALVTAVSAVAWGYAERMIANHDDRLNWDIAWIVAATITVLLGLWLLVDAVRRGRSLGWDHVWRVWEAP